MKKEVRRLFFREDSHSPVHTGRLALIDIETSGLSFAKGAEIVEVAVLLMEQDGTVVDEYQTLVGARGGAGDSSIHQITDEMLWGAPRFADIAADLLDFVGDAVLVAHNASFEDRFLLPEFERAGIYGLQLPALCSLRAARAALPYLSSHKLGDLMDTYGYRMRDAHTALGDVRALGRILPSILQDIPALRFGLSSRPAISPMQTPACTREDAVRGRSVQATSARVPRSRVPRSAETAPAPVFAPSPRTEERVPRSRTPRSREAAKPQWTGRLSFLPTSD